jgi:hypothetical protein
VTTWMDNTTMASASGDAEDHVFLPVPFCGDSSSGDGDEIIPDEFIPVGIGPNRLLQESSTIDDTREDASGGENSLAPDVLVEADADTVILPDHQFANASNKRKVYNLGDRQKNTRKFQVKREKHTDMTNVLATLQSTCCKGKRCLSWFSAQEVMKEREMFWSLKQFEQKNFLMDACKKASIYDENGGITQLRLPFLGKTVCSVAIGKLYGLASQRVSSISKDVKEGKSTCCHERLSRVRSLSVSSAQILSWMQKYFALNTESMPNSNRYHLADSLTKKAVYEIFLLRNRHVYDSAHQPSKQRFLKIWREECPLICIPSVKRFSVCAQCSGFKAGRDRATNRIDRGTVYTHTCMP